MSTEQKSGKGLGLGILTRKNLDSTDYSITKDF